MTNDITGWHNAAMARSITVIASKLDLGEFRLPRSFVSTDWEIRETCGMIETCVFYSAIDNRSDCT